MSKDNKNDSGTKNKDVTRDEPIRWKKNYDLYNLKGQMGTALTDDEIEMFK